MALWKRVFFRSIVHLPGINIEMSSIVQHNINCVNHCPCTWIDRSLHIRLHYIMSPNYWQYCDNWVLPSHFVFVRSRTSNMLAWKYDSNNARTFITHLVQNSVKGDCIRLPCVRCIKRRFPVSESSWWWCFTCATCSICVFPRLTLDFCCSSASVAHTADVCDFTHNGIPNMSSTGWQCVCVEHSGKRKMTTFGCKMQWFITDENLCAYWVECICIMVG